MFTTMFCQQINPAANVTWPIGCVYASFRSHMYRDHRGYHSALTQNPEVNLQCQISFCEYTCQDVAGFLGHLKRHIAENVEIQCPFKACIKAFSVRSSFTAHVSRCHRERNVSGLCESIVKSSEMVMMRVTYVMRMLWQIFHSLRTVWQCFI